MNKLIIFIIVFVLLLLCIIKTKNIENFLDPTQCLAVNDIDIIKNVNCNVEADKITQENIKKN